MVICLELGADLHMAQLMPLPLTVSCFSKIQIGFTFLVTAHPCSPGQKAVKRVCVCVYILFLQLTRVVPEKGPLNGCLSVCPQVAPTLTPVEYAVPSSHAERATMPPDGMSIDSVVFAGLRHTNHAV